MGSFNQKMIQLVLGRRGGSTRVKILRLLFERPYNTNQMAHLLNLNYGTIKYHVNKLLENGMIEGSGIEGYGQVYNISSDMRESRDIFEKVVKRYSDIKASPDLFEDMIKQTHDSVFFLDNDGNVLFTNESAERLFGYTEEEILGRPLNIFVDPGFLKRASDSLNNEKEVRPMDIKGRTKAGDIKDINVHIDVIENAVGDKIGTYVLSRDITERKKVERALTDAEDLLEDILETLPIPIVLLDDDIRMVYANPSFCHLFEIEQKGCLMKTLYTLWDRHLNIPELKGTIGELVTKDIPIKDYRVTLDLPKGRRKTMLVNIRRLTRGHGKGGKLLLTMEDLSTLSS
jgi:PAS domain S-box-containing protein